jgi:DNA polymerase I-like protein with 3'-5' exonuclease and polymerase domains
LGLAYIDFEQEEFLIAAVLAQDFAGIRAYAQGDAYAAFGVLAGFIPPGGTEDSHPWERNLAKTLALATTYGMSAPGLAGKAGVSLNRAKDLLATLRQIFRTLWRWSDAQIHAARWTGFMETAYGWRLAVNSKTETGTLGNFKIRGTAADILRLAAIFLYEAGVKVCAPVHDAFLIQAPESELEEAAQEASRQMVRASRYVLGDYVLRTKIELLRHPDRLHEPRGKAMWDRIISIANRLESKTSTAYRAHLSHAPIART